VRQHVSAGDDSFWDEKVPELQSPRTAMRRPWGDCPSREDGAQPKKWTEVDRSPSVGVGGSLFRTYSADADRRDHSKQAEAAAGSRASSV